jgi:hypothetical protein
MKKLAIMSEVKIGMRDCNVPVMWFSVHPEPGCGALQVLTWDEAYQLIKDYDVRELSGLKGKPCWVDHDGNKIIYKGPCIINE